MSNWLILAEDWRPTQISGVLHTQSGRTARRWIESQAVDLDRIILTQETWDADFLQLLHAAKSVRPLTPVYVFDSGLKQDWPVDSGIAGRVTPTELDLLLLDRSGCDAVARIPNDETQPGYLGIPLSDLEAIDVLPMDLFVRISEGKFIRVLVSGESQFEERIDGYRRKGLRHLYVRREEHETFLKNLENLRESIPLLLSDSNPLKTAWAVQNTLRLMSALKSADELSPDLWDKIRGNLLLLREAMHSDSIDLDAWVRRCALLDHSLSVFVISGLLGKHLYLKREESFLKLSMAALFHDIALLDFPVSIPQDENPTQLLSSDKSLFQMHPQLSAEYVERHLGQDLLTRQAIQFHHWRKDASGVVPSVEPHPHSVPVLAEVIGFAEECSNDLLLRPEMDLAKLAARVEARLKFKFSPELFQSMRGLLQDQARYRRAQFN